MPHRVAALAFEGMAPFELGCVVEIFRVARPDGVEWYDLTVCAEAAGPLDVVGGFTMTPSRGLDAFAEADTIVIPGVRDVRSPVSPAVVEAMRSAHANGARIVSICSGAFAVAATGLLDGRTATTHWRYAPLLAARFPEVTVTPDVLYVDHGDVLTSAGSAAGLDLLLHVVRSDHGPTVANTVARRLVIAPHRAGGQAQFIETPVTPTEEDAVGRAMEWALTRLATPITVREMARRAAMSERSFLRHFARKSGMSPLKWVIAQRIAASLPLLEGTATPVEEVATVCGFDSPVTFRHHFARAMKTSPSAYRRAFQAAGLPAVIQGRDIRHEANRATHLHAMAGQDPAGAGRAGGRLAGRQAPAEGPRGRAERQDQAGPPATASAGES
nr:helix-turn-helix domain-containing protein [Herbidospora cretacea]